MHVMLISCGAHRKGREGTQDEMAMPQGENSKEQIKQEGSCRYQACLAAKSLSRVRLTSCLGEGEGGRNGECCNRQGIITRMSFLLDVLPHGKRQKAADGIIDWRNGN